ncbi:hypothetical protein HCH_02941 [Hahella chejuensis KCTC 2396]|uniref:Uncharacterized protein n=1 Tax=Hahella chejuensis (strain KCTC 2396) TaxID=349521 RepID=Q2SI11_HAHCH|nr:hypothetical protein HCH_02941 [Hahella chejuensis KCTC 2396]
MQTNRRKLFVCLINNSLTQGFHGKSQMTNSGSIVFA